MSNNVYLAPILQAPLIVTVAPTTTTILTIATGGAAELITIQLENLDGTQTFVGTVQRRLASTNTWAASTLGDFEAVAPGTSVVMDLDARGTGDLRLVGTMSGAGGNVQVTARRRAA